MSDIAINIHGIQNKVQPHLKQGNIVVQKTFDNIVSLTIPNDFPYKTKFVKYLSTLNETKKDVISIIKDINQVVEDFEKAENKNKKLLENITSKPIKQIGNVGSTIKDEIIEKGENIKTKFNEIFQINDFNSVIENTAATISGGWNALCENLIEPGFDMVKKTGASVVNVKLSVLKGLAQFAESLLDAAVLAKTVAVSIHTVKIDAIGSLVARITGNEWKFVTGKMWEKSMDFVATEHVKSAYKSFYEKTEIGKWLNENSFEWFQSDSVINQVVSGIGYATGIIIISLCTAGAGGVAVGAASGASAAAASGVSTVTTSAVVAGTSALGKYTEEYWAKAKNDSWEGMKEKYEVGEITEEQFNSFQMVRNISEEDWKEIEEDHINGKITKEQFEMMKQIREMPNDWKTLEKGFMGLVNGVSNAAWEGIQWYVGGKLAGTIMKGGQLVTSATRIGTDTAFNAMDTPFRTLIDAITSDRSFQEAWVMQGGWKSVLANAGVGLVGSVAGEAIDLSKMNKTGDFDKIIKQNEKLFEGIDADSLNNMLKKLEKDYLNGDIKLTTSEIQKSIKAVKTDEFDKIIGKNIKLFEGIDADSVNNILQKLEKDYLNGDLKLSTSEIQESIKAVKTDEFDKIIGKNVKLLEGMDADSVNNILQKLEKDYLSGNINLTKSDIQKAINDSTHVTSYDGRIRSKGIINRNTPCTMEYINKYIKPQLENNKALRGNGITREQIEDACKKICVAENWEELANIYKKLHNGKKEMPQGMRAFNKGGIVYISAANNSDGAVTHEIVHNLGQIEKYWSKYEGINEAFTDNIANNTLNTVNVNGYTKNAEVINNINIILEQKYGIKNLDVEAYVKKDFSIYRNKIDSLVGEGFVDELAENMNAMTMRFKGLEQQREIARTNIDNLFEYFKKEINSK